MFPKGGNDMTELGMGFKA